VHRLAPCPVPVRAVLDFVRFPPGIRTYNYALLNTGDKKLSLVPKMALRRSTSCCCLAAVGIWAGSYGMAATGLARP
jgi:hypothetical protein